MQKETMRNVFLEFIWLTNSFVLSVLLSLFLLGRNFLSGPINIQLHDSYFVIEPFHFFLSLFFMVTFIVYFIKESRYSYRRTLSSWILIIVGISLIITLTFLIKTISQFSPDGWTLYPPLSALGPDKDAELTQGFETNLITIFFKIIQVLVLTMILYVSFRWVVQKNRPK